MYFLKHLLLASSKLLGLAGQFGPFNLLAWYRIPTRSGKYRPFTLRYRAAVNLLRQLLTFQSHASCLIEQENGPWYLHFSIGFYNVATPAVIYTTNTLEKDSKSSLVAKSDLLDFHFSIGFHTVETIAVNVAKTAVNCQVVTSELLDLHFSIGRHNSCQRSERSGKLPGRRSGNSGKLPGRDIRSAGFALFHFPQRSHNSGQRSQNSGKLPGRDNRAAEPNW